MNRRTQNAPLLQHLFGKTSLVETGGEELHDMIKKYPYFAQARWLLAEKKWYQDQDRRALRLAGVYAFHPLRLQQHFPGGQTDNNKVSSPGIKENSIPASADAESTPGKPEPPDSPASVLRKADPESRPAAPLIQPLFTEDYFAYTGAKLPDYIENDKRPTMEQLHSFTDWLRTMKRPRGTTDPDIRGDEALLAAHQENEDAGIQRDAADSVRPGDEVFTEAMAEVRAGKGQTDKAIAIYKKLSLSNPEKSAYFAQKIKALKNK